MKLFVTGGTGNIGQYVIQELLARKHELIMYTRTPERIPEIGKLEGVRLVKGNLLDHDVMGKALTGCDGVVHIALGYGLTPVEMLQHDTLSTVYLLEKAEQAGIKNFVYTSSTAAIGNLKDGTDENSRCEPDTLYGATKAASEQFLIGFRQYYEAQAVRGRKVLMRRNIIRPGYTFSNPAFEGGASESDKRFRDYARAALKGEDIIVSENDGTQFIASHQIAKVYAALVESNLNQEVFLALGEKWISWADIARWTIACVPHSRSQVRTPEGDKPQKPAIINVGKIKSVFGLSFDATEDLRQHVAWNIEREQRVLTGEPVHDVYHVW
jgi:UDP-glucose 4-epimerase